MSEKQYSVRQFDFREYWLWLAGVVGEPASPIWFVRGLMEGLKRGPCGMFLLLLKPSFRTIDCTSGGLEGEAIDKCLCFFVIFV
jgi:hypothetical protein